MKVYGYIRKTESQIINSNNELMTCNLPLKYKLDVFYYMCNQH
jgi:hypothetical protein